MTVQRRRLVPGKAPSLAVGARTIQLSKGRVKTNAHFVVRGYELYSKSKDGSPVPGDKYNSTSGSDVRPCGELQERGGWLSPELQPRGGWPSPIERIKY
jgi:hypothetical protein